MVRTEQTSPAPADSTTTRPEAEPLAVSIPIKRPRGRPRKIRPEETANAPIAATAEAIMVRTTKAPPAPGDSPTKRPAAEPLAAGTPTKRPRGRPRKIRPEETENAPIAAASVYDFPGDDGDSKTVANTILNGTPSKRRTKDVFGDAQTPKGRKKATAPSTPSTKDVLRGAATPQWRRNDRSARKKSARAMIEKVINGEDSDEDADEAIAREIYASSDEEGEQGDEAQALEVAPPIEAVTPTKRGRGRPRKNEVVQRKKSPTPPRDLPPHEMYFTQNRTGSSKTSHNTLASLSLLTHEEYFDLLRDYKDRHADDSGFLESIHAESFPQWAFEMSQGFGVCIYGYGSKRPLLHRFAKYIYDKTTNHDTSPIVMINGYVRNTSARDILGTVASAVDSAFKLPSGGPAVMLESVKTLLSAHEIEITLIVNSIDAVPLRRPGFQPILAQLAAQPNIRFICSADTPDFQLLWDSGLRSFFNFAFHDCTTFSPFTSEMDVVDDVHELLGRKARRVGGKEGVTYVLRSLPENAKNLFKLLVSEVLMAIDDEGTTGGENPGVEYRMMYSKAVEEFICSSEMAFRTLLKEFHDHQIITSRKDVLGTELLSLPFRREELEAILEDLYT